MRKSIPKNAMLRFCGADGREFIFTYPIVAETFDFLNEANGEHVKVIHAFQALDDARPGPVEEGAVGVALERTVAVNRLSGR